MDYVIEATVFTLAPQYLRGVVIVDGVQNRPSPDALVSQLRAAEEGVRSRLTPEGLTDEPRLTSWREIFRAFGARPSDFRPSVDALVRRVLRGQELPSINALVDIGTIVSLRHLCPVGVHPLEGLNQDLVLRAARGSDRFLPAAGEEDEAVPEGEIVLAHGDSVLTRRWVWRQAATTLTELSSRSVFFNLDVLPPVDEDEMAAMADETESLVHDYCGGTTRYGLLSEREPRLRLR